MKRRFVCIFWVGSRVRSFELLLYRFVRGDGLVCIGCAVVICGEYIFDGERGVFSLFFYGLVG